MKFGGSKELLDTYLLRGWHAKNVLCQQSTVHQQQYIAVDEMITTNVFFHEGQKPALD